MKKQEIEHPKLYFNYILKNNEIELSYYSNKIDNSGKRIAQKENLSIDKLRTKNLLKHLNEIEYKKLLIYILRQEKVNRIQNDIAETEIYGENSGDLLLLSWGGTFGACRSATETLQEKGLKVSHVHIRWISPLPKDLGDILIQFKDILIPEINLGQFLKLIRSEYLVDAKGLNLVRGRPIGAETIIKKVNEILG